MCVGERARPGGLQNKRDEGPQSAASIPASPLTEAGSHLGATGL